MIIGIFDQGWAQITLSRLELMTEKGSVTLLTKIIDEIIKTHYLRLNSKEKNVFISIESSLK